MEAFLSSTLAVAIAEIGDKTQLLSLFLAARFIQRQPAIIAGILLATLLNHAASAWLGVFVMQWIPPQWGHWLVVASFALIALWLLIPDKDDGAPSSLDRYGAFVATTVLFFLAEIGDKTQIATVILAANYNAPLLVVAGSTLGMLAANVPVVMAGQWLMDRLPMRYARWGACGLFMVLAVVTLLQGPGN
jgi:putative Ca2+/H+ antiporter (TMEM165/GDT1 family)